VVAQHVARTDDHEPSFVLLPLKLPTSLAGFMELSQTQKRFL